MSNIQIIPEIITRKINTLVTWFVWIQRIEIAYIFHCLRRHISNDNLLAVDEHQLHPGTNGNENANIHLQFDGSSS